jgi:transcriptional regulator with XRE-family HTH domain
MGTSATSTEQISESVRVHRSEKGWSQLELANRAGLDRKTVNRIENGRFAPSVTTLLAVSTALGVSVNNLLGEK